MLIIVPSWLDRVYGQLLAAVMHDSTEAHLDSDSSTDSRQTQKSDSDSDSTKKELIPIDSDSRIGI